MKNNFVDMCKKIGINVTLKQLESLDTYYNFLVEYNKITNVTSITNEDDVYLKHFYDSLTLVKACDFTNVNNLLDIGSGAGFPGMVIKIFYPNVNVTLLDSNNKKTTFLKGLSEKLNLNVQVINNRAENFAQDHLNSFDIVTSRAVAYVDIISSLSLPFVKNNGKVILMKGDFALEKQFLQNVYEKLNIKKYQIIDVSYLDNPRNLIILEKNLETRKILSYTQILKNHDFWQKKMQ